MKEGIREEIEKLSFYTHIILLYGCNKNCCRKSQRPITKLIPIHINIISPCKTLIYREIYFKNLCMWKYIHQKNAFKEAYLFFHASI